MRKFLIVGAIVVVGLIGAWIYCLTAAPPWLSNFARGASVQVAQAVGIHAFDEQPKSADGKEPKKETVTDLPEGYYLYVGSRPAQTPPKWVFVDPAHVISWVNEAPPISTPAKSDKPAVATKAGGKKDENSPYEEYEYPKIKWRAKPLPGAEGAIAQLSTTYERAANGGQGAAKYRLTLFKAGGKGSHEVQLLDANGFKLLEFNAADFHEIPGSDLMEARDSFACDEDQYRQARDYSVD